jgi:hypothetical protein
MNNGLILRANLNETIGGVFTGGTQTVNGDYVIHTITSSQNIVWTGTTSLQAEVLLVGGGGIGGRLGDISYPGGGGGGGEVLLSTINLSAGTHPIVIGDKSGIVGSSNNGFTSFATLTAVSGGDGGRGASSGGTDTNGKNGGSGGGGGTKGSGQTTGGLGTTGGDGGNGQANGAGGGGAAPDNGGNGGGAAPPGDSTGGTGFLTTIRGTNEYFGGGGAGGVPAFGPAIAGGLGGGGNSRAAGTKATGGGGGGSSTASDINAGSGIVIIRYLLSNIQRPVNYDLDTFSDIPFRVDVSAIQNNEIGSNFGIASQAISLPGSKANNEFFQAAFNVNSPNARGFKRSVDCQVIQDGAAVFKGNLILNEVVTDSESDTTYSVTLVNESVDFTTLIKEQYISQLDFPELVHPFNITSITASWEDDNSFLNGDVYYPLVDYGTDGTDPNLFPIEFGGTVGKVDNIASPMQIQQFKPSIRVKKVIDKIFESVGYQYSSTFFDSAEFSTIYALTTADDKLGIVQQQSQDAGFRVTNTSNQTLVGPFDQQTLLFQSEIYDPANQYNTGTSRFTITNAGTYAFNASLDFVKAGVNDRVAFATLALIKNGTQIAQQFYDLKTMYSGTLTFASAGFPLVATDYIELRLTWDGQDTGFSPTDLTINAASTFGTIYAPVISVGGDVYMSAQFDPSIKSLDFLKGIIEKFNLVIEPKKNERNTLIIEPFDTWADSGVVKDWSEKYDRATKISIKHPIQSQPRKIIFSDAFDSDVLTDYSKNNFDSVNSYGTYTYTTNSDIAQGEKKIGGFFGPLPTKGIQGAPGIILPQLYRSDNGSKKSFKYKPRLGYRIDNRSSVGAKNGVFYIYNSDTATSDTFNSYSTISSIQSYPIGAGKSLHFDASKWYPFHDNYAEGNTPLGAYTQYWGRYINELYDDSSRIVTLNMKFNPIELKDIQLNDKIFIDNAYYRINKISGFNITERDNVQVELLKAPIRKFKFPRTRIYTGPFDPIGIGIGIAERGDFEPRGNVVVTTDDGDIVTNNNQLRNFAVNTGLTYISGSVYWKPEYNPYLNAASNQAIYGTVTIDGAAGAIIGTQDGGSIGQDVDKAVLIGTDNIIESSVKNSIISGDSITVGQDSTNISVFSSQDSTIISASDSTTLIGTLNGTIGGSLNSMIGSENSVMIANITQSTMIGAQSITFSGNNTFERHTHIGGDGFAYYSAINEGVESFTNSVGLGQLPDVSVNPGVSKTNKVIIGDVILTGAQYLNITEYNTYTGFNITIGTNDQTFLSRLSWSTVSGSGAAYITLPDATLTHGRFLRFLTDGTWPSSAPSATCWLVASGSQTIDGVAEVALHDEYDGIGIVSTGTEWAVIQRKA